MYSSTMLPVPSGELSSTTIVSTGLFFGKFSSIDFKMESMFCDSLYVGTIIETCSLPPLGFVSDICSTTKVVKILIF